MEFSDNRPIYIQIADHFCNQIISRKWEEDERIPSVREVAVMMEVNPNTAIRAFHYLQDLGILYNQRGIGYFLADNAFDLVKELKREEFIRTTLPDFFRDMKQLGFSFSELAEIYKKQHEDTH